MPETHLGCLTDERILHIVRRYGRVGGMESYVWELTHALSSRGARIDVLCEQASEMPGADIRVHQLGTSFKKPGWLSALRFSRKVEQWLSKRPYALVHSHERTACHNVVTFHGPPFARIRQRPAWQRQSLRIHASLWLEHSMLLAPGIRAIVPNSTLIRELLLASYPQAQGKLTAPIPPGVIPPPPRPQRHLPPEGGTIGFIGREWKRKGLDLAINIVERMREIRPKIELFVLGPEPSAIEHLFRRWKGGYRLLGDCDARPWFKKLDLVLHPARMEPFGMALTEALAARVPVVASEQCGARDAVLPERVLPLNAPIQLWAERALEALGNPQQPYERTWDQVAIEHLALYQKLIHRNTRNDMSHRPIRDTRSPLTSKVSEQRS
ncbi:MAG: glycosyltransferase [Calditrichaeota bacterium]|nr:MAG: glycosyltransferase [Calditrichota bacterium]